MSGPCCVDPGAKQTHDIQGNVETVAGLSTYKTGLGKSAIVIFTDVFGCTFVNTQKVADTLAQGTDTTVLVPDLFNDDPIDANEPDLWGKLPAWLKKHPVAEACAASDKFIATIKGHYETVQVSENLSHLSFEISASLRADHWLLLWRQACRELDLACGILLKYQSG